MSNRQGGASTPLASVETTTVRVTMDGTESVAHITYDNPALDLAILCVTPPETQHHERTHSRASPALSLSEYTPNAGDCIVMLTTRALAGSRRFEVHHGTVIYGYAHSRDIKAIAVLQENTLPTTLRVLRRDSGSPVLLLREGVTPIVVGVVSGTRWPHEHFGYVNAASHILPILWITKCRT